MVHVSPHEDAPLRADHELLQLGVLGFLRLGRSILDERGPFVVGDETSLAHGRNVQSEQEAQSLALARARRSRSLWAFLASRVGFCSLASRPGVLSYAAWWALYLSVALYA